MCRINPGAPEHGGPAGILNLNEAKSGVRVSLHRSFGSLRQMRDRLITLCGGCRAVRHGHQITSAPRTIVEFLSTLSAQSADSFNCGGRNTHLPPPWTARSCPNQETWLTLFDFDKNSADICRLVKASQPLVKTCTQPALVKVSRRDLNSKPYFFRHDRCPQVTA